MALASEPGGTSRATNEQQPKSSPAGVATAGAVRPLAGLSREESMLAVIDLQQALSMSGPAGSPGVGVAFMHALVRSMGLALVAES